MKWCDFDALNRSCQRLFAMVFAGKMVRDAAPWLWAGYFCLSLKNTLSKTAFFQGMRRLAYSSLWPCYVMACSRVLKDRSKNLPASTTWWTRSSLMVWQLEGAEKRHQASAYIYNIYIYNNERRRVVLCLASPSRLQTASHLPWNIKPVLGMLSDGFPLFGFHRTSWLGSERRVQQWDDFSMFPWISSVHLLSMSAYSLNLEVSASSCNMCEVPCHHVQCQCSATPSNCLYRCICDGSFSLSDLQQFDSCIFRTLAHVCFYTVFKPRLKRVQRNKG